MGEVLFWGQGARPESYRNDFGRDVGGRAHEGPARHLHELRLAEVRNFDVFGNGEQNVFGLDVSVENPLEAVQVLEALQDLLRVDFDLVLAHGQPLFAQLLDFVLERAAARVLEENVQVVALGVEEVVLHWESLLGNFRVPMFLWRSLLPSSNSLTTFCMKDLRSICGMKKFLTAKVLQLWWQ